MNIVKTVNSKEKEIAVLNIDVKHMEEYTF